MKYIPLLLFQVLAFKGMAQMNVLNVTIPNINKVQGSIVIALYNEPGNFIKAGKEYRKMTRKVSAATEIFSFKDLPAGEYGIAIYHDKNDDGKCNTNAFGMPREGYGFSRNFKPRFSAPVFNDTKVKLESDTNLEIRMIY